MAYQLDIYTGDRSGAGTDANVSVVLKGERGDTPAVVINPLISGDAFESGDHNVVQLNVPDVGDIEAVQISHDDMYAGSGWYLDKVVVTRRATGVSMEYPCYNWLATDEGDGAISRQLPAAGATWQVELVHADRDEFFAGEDYLVLNNWEGSSELTRQAKWRFAWSKSVNVEESKEKIHSVEVAANIGGNLKGMELGASAQYAFESHLTNKYGTTTNEESEVTHTDTYIAAPGELVLVVVRWYKIYEFGTLKRGNVFVNYAVATDVRPNIEPIAIKRGELVAERFRAILKDQGVNTHDITWQPAWSDGTLVKGSSAAVYVMENGVRRPFPSAERFEALGYSWDEIMTVSDIQLKGVPAGAPM